MRKTLTLTLTVLAMGAALSLAACGSDGDGESTGRESIPASSQEQGARGQPGEQSAPSKSDRPSEKAKGGQGAEPSADPRVQALQTQFPQPKPAPGAKRLSAEAIEAGKQACRGKTPQQVKEEFYAQAEANLDSGQRTLIDELSKYEKEAAKDSSFVAGQLAATVYSATLPEAERRYGFQGCAYVLARGLAEEIAGS